MFKQKLLKGQRLSLEMEIAFSPLLTLLPPFLFFLAKL